jgi:Skp family chaperone for outer membrane proteins
MKRVSFLISIALLAAFTAHAQRTSAPSGAQNPAVPASKIAVIYSEAFQDSKVGIAQFAATISKLNAEFQTIQNELNQTKQRLDALQEEIKKMQQGATPATPQQIQARIDQLDDQKKVYQRKGEDARANYQRRRNELLAPLQDEVGKALEAFGKSFGITMILDGSQLPLVYAADNVDITRQFIADYNRKHPATAARP